MSGAFGKPQILPTCRNTSPELVPLAVSRIRRAPSTSVRSSSVFIPSAAPSTIRFEVALSQLARPNGPGFLSAARGAQRGASRVDRCHSRRATGGWDALPEILVESDSSSQPPCNFKTRNRIERMFDILSPASSQPATTRRNVARCLPRLSRGNDMDAARCQKDLGSGLVGCTAQ